MTIYNITTPVDYFGPNTKVECVQKKNGRIFFIVRILNRTGGLVGTSVHFDVKPVHGDIVRIRHKQYSERKKYSPLSELGEVLMSFTLDRTSIDEWVVDDPKLRVRQHKLRQNRLNQQRLDYNKLILKQKLSIRRERVRQKQLRKQNLVDIDVCEICHRTHNSMTPLQHRIPFKECVDCGEQHGSRGCEVIEIC